MRVYLLLLQAKWAAVSLAERTELVKAAVRRICLDKAGLSKMITREMGKTLAEAEEEVDGNADRDEYCELVRAANEPEIHGGSVIVRHPHGVVSTPGGRTHCHCHARQRTPPSSPTRTHSCA